MIRPLAVGIGCLIAVMGVIWTLQGLGYIGGSVMSGVTFWAVVGPVVALIGLAIAIWGLRRRLDDPRVRFDPHGGVCSPSFRLCRGLLFI